MLRTPPGRYTDEPPTTTGASADAAAAGIGAKRGMGAAAAAPAAEASCGAMCAASAAGVGWSMVAVLPSDNPSSPSREFDSSISVNESMPSSMKVK